MDWSHLIEIVLTVLSTGGVMAAIFKYLLDSREAKHKNERENRGDEVGTLSGIIKDLRARVEYLEAESGKIRKEYDKDNLELRDKYTACLQQEGHLRGRIEVLEKEAAERRGGDGDGAGGGECCGGDP